MKNALTIDLEDWFCAENLSCAIKYDQWDSCELRIVNNTNRLLDLLDKKNVKATFFVLGWIAERVPELIKTIEESGHEIASHGYSHYPALLMTVKDFEDDVQNASKVLRRITDNDVIGYRCPSFSITKKTLWVFEVLKRNGFKYDSSIFPYGYHPGYGIGGFSLGVSKAGNSIIEFPLSCVKFLGMRVPFGGGGYFRFYPLFLSRYFMNSCNKEGRNFIFYLHPWEIDTNQPQIRLPFIKKLRHYYNLKNTLHKFENVLSDFSFTTIRSILNL